MPNRPPKKKTNTQEPEFSDELLDKLLEGYGGPDDMFGQDGLLDRLKSRLVERSLHTELTHHLGYDKHDTRPEGTENARNGTGPIRKIKTESGEIEVSVPRDRDGSFEPALLPKYARRIEGFDDMVIGLYARGMSTRDIQDQLQEIYKFKVSPDLISDVTDEILVEVTEWQNRPLEDVYPIVYFDALVTKVRTDGRVVKRAVYIALGISLDGQKEVLGMWVGENEGAKFWLGILTELKNRGMQDMFIACVDGLKGFPEAIEVEYPQTEVQVCIVHMVRHSLRFVGWKERKQVAADLKTIYRAPTEAAARQALSAFREKWDKQFPTIGDSWERNWENLNTFFAYPEEIRRAIYTTNAIESLNHSLRKLLKTKKAFPNETALTKVLYLGLRRASAKWTRPIQHWKAAMQRFAALFSERMPEENKAA